MATAIAITSGVMQLVSNLVTHLPKIINAITEAKKSFFIDSKLEQMLGKIKEMEQNIQNLQRLVELKDKENDDELRNELKGFITLITYMKENSSTFDKFAPPEAQIHNTFDHSEYRLHESHEQELEMAILENLEIFAQREKMKDEGYVHEYAMGYETFEDAYQAAIDQSMQEQEGRKHIKYATGYCSFEDAYNAALERSLQE